VKTSHSYAAPVPTFAAEAQACPVCDAPPPRHRFLFVKQQATFVRCLDCGFQFINPRPTDAWIAARYRYYSEQYFGADSKLASDFNPERYRTEVALLGPTRGRLLDVGCATGSFVAAAGAAGFEAHGIDIAAASTRHGREQRGLDLDTGNLYERAYPAASFDVVTLWATLEHLVDPNRFVAEAHRLLRAGGMLAISVPNHGGISQRLLGRRNRYLGIDHVNCFTAPTLARLLRRHRLRAERTFTDRVNPVVIWQDLRGVTAEGASIEQQLHDQRATDAVKYGVRRSARIARIAHRAAVSVLRLGHLGDLLYAIARKSE